MASVDGCDEGIFDRNEGFQVEVLGEFSFGFVIAENAVGLVWIGAC